MDDESCVSATRAIDGSRRPHPTFGVFQADAAVLDESGLCCGRLPTRIRGDPRFTPRVHATQQSPKRSDRQPIKLLLLLFAACDCVEGLSPSGMTSALRMHADVDPRMANRETRTGDERSLVTIKLRRNLNCFHTSLHASAQCPKRARGQGGACSPCLSNSAVRAKA